MRRILFLIALFLFTHSGKSQQNYLLNGTWKISLQPPAGFWKNSISTSSWSDVQVPGECLMQGFKIESDKEFVYKRSIDIPAESGDKKIMIRFDGVYSYARVWINGEYVRDHFGGFTTWYCDITKFVKAGKPAWLTVAVRDKKDDISFASNYAHHLIAGILRDVSMVILPKDNVSNFHVETDFDDLKNKGILKISAKMNFEKFKNANVLFRLKDKNGKEIKITNKTIIVSKSTPEIIHTIQIDNPTSWNAEAPYLYTLEMDVWNEDELIQNLSKKIGIRKIAIYGGELFINKMPVKLRGACHHDVHPLYGRSTNDKLDELDVKLMKEANINFVRTSHYPPSEHFLDMCDQYGIYVEEENAICFLQNQPDMKPLNTSDEPYVSRAVAQLEEMMEKDRDHASVIIWSIGNESKYGTMFKKEYEYAKSHDKTRPVIFSYPNTIKAAKGSKCYDLLSLHYISYKGELNDNSEWQPTIKNFNSDTIPVLHDEYAHLSCYNKFTLTNDPGVREFWGESITKFWNSMFDSTGCLGGSIWAWADEIFYLSDTAVGYGPWGAVDGWRRPKPEFWHLKKAYSPIKILNYTYDQGGLKLKLFNRFDHTSLAKVRIEWESKGKQNKFPLNHTLPHQTDEYFLPVSVQGKNVVTLRFYLDSLLIDITNIVLKKPEIDISSFAPNPMSINKEKETTTIKNKNFLIEFNHFKGIMNYAICGSDTVLKSGPFLNFGYKNYEQGWESQKPKAISAIINQQNWTCEKFDCKKDGNNVVVEMSGKYDSVKIDYIITITDQGMITTKYNVDKVPSNASVVGLRYQVPSSINAISWKHRGQWEMYPKDHIGRAAGRAEKFYANHEDFKKEPTWPWKDDVQDYFLNGKIFNDSIFGPASRDFKSQKFNVFEYSLLSASAVNHASVISEAKVSAKMDVMKDGSQFLCVNNLWRYPDLGWGNYTGPEMPAKYEGIISLILHPIQ